MWNLLCLFYFHTQFSFLFIFIFILYFIQAFYVFLCFFLNKWQAFKFSSLDFHIQASQGVHCCLIRITLDYVFVFCFLSALHGKITCLWGKSIFQRHFQIFLFSALFSKFILKFWLSITLIRITNLINFH